MYSKARKMLLGSIVALATIALAACGAGSTTTTPSKGYDLNYTYQTPSKTGGTVVIGSNALPDSSNIMVNRFLNNTVYDAELDNALYQACYVQLPNIALTNPWVTDGCASVTATQDANGNTVVTAKLDPQAKWSDGTPVTSKDWRLSFDASQDANVGGNALSPPYDKATVSFPDDSTFIINYHQPYAPWRVDLATDYYALPSQSYKDSFDPTKYTAGTDISFAGSPNTAQPDPSYNSDVFQADIGVTGSNANTVADTTQSITDGPYMLSGPFTDGTVTTMAPNPNYHSTFFHQSALSKLVFKISTNANTETEAYKAGQYDAAFDFNISNLATFSGIPSAEVINTSAASEEYEDYMQRDSAPNAKGTADHHSIFTNENVRKAFEEGFDKCGAIVALTGLQCTDPSIYTDQFTAPPDANYAPNVPAVKYNVSDANSLLDAAGFKLDSHGLRTYPGTTNEVSVVIAAKNNRPIRESMVTLMKDELSQNLHITATTLLSAKMYSPFTSGGILTTGACDLCEAGYVGYAEPDQNSDIFEPANIPSASNVAGVNWMGINDPQISQFLKQGRTTLDPAARIKIYQQFFAYLDQHAITWGLYITPNIALVKTTLGNYKQHPTQQGFNWNVSDYYTTGNS